MNELISLLEKEVHNLRVLLSYLESEELSSTSTQTVSQLLNEYINTEKINEIKEAMIKNYGEEKINDVAQKYIE